VAHRLTTERLILRGWRLEDAPDALRIYGHTAVARWLSPIMERVPDLPAMRLLLRQWIAEDTRSVPPVGRWAIERREDHRVIGGVSLLPLPPGNQDVEISWHLTPDAWGQGYASESTFEIARWAFSEYLEEIFALVRPDNTRAASTVRRNGMQWVGETDKYFGVTMQVYRLRPGDLDRSAPEARRPPRYDFA
jgi:RimJ/RimL family protein N-acetyltransferase